MLKDYILVWKVQHGNSDTLCVIYEKYKKDMLSLANALLHDIDTAEDIVHDVFVSFAGSIGKFKLTGSLKGYLLKCVVNLSRDRIRENKRRPNKLNNMETQASNCTIPVETIITAEEITILRNAIAKLPYEQREVVVLHLQASMTFRQVAKIQKTSISTAQSRYRYGLEKIKILLNNEVEK